jgi:hypothetical protein
MYCAPGRVASEIWVFPAENILLSWQFCMVETPMAKVHDNAENVEICEKFAGPAQLENQLKDAPPMPPFVGEENL